MTYSKTTLAFALWGFILLTAFGPPATSAQTIIGTVVDVDGRPVAAASVLVRSEQLQQYRYGTTTALDGTFTVGPLTPGRYLFTTRHVAFDADTRAVEVRPDRDETIEIRLSETTMAHPEVVVAAGRVQPQLSPITFSNITADELRSRPDMKDLPATLSSRPSTTYYSENGNGIGYSTLRIRGFDQRRIAVSINGIPQNDPEDFNVFWINFFDVDGAVEDIQIQRGGGASQYGSVGIGGAINIVALPYRPYP
ncbi:MAG: carboxypeptidase regulatory-like domain-containing protein, partial [Rhodothermales bacterium]|nr:carboxypeptidase regulatory-like domain-containing protein [Rhodothermales bacterium]